MEPRSLNCDEVRRQWANVLTNDGVLDCEVIYTHGVRAWV